jgi:hypothetical protein
VSKSSNPNQRLITLPSNVRRPFLEFTLKVNGLKVAIAIGFNGLLLAVQRFDQRLVLAIGRWGNRR